MFYENEDDINEVAKRAKAIHVDERRITLQSVKIVAELDSRRAWFFLGMSIDQMAMHIGLSPSMYYKRLKAAKIMKEFPEALEAFERGEIQISHIALIGNRITPANAKIIFENIKYKTKREVEDFLARVTSSGVICESEGIIERTLRMNVGQAAVLNRVIEVMASSGHIPTFIDGLVRSSEAYLEQHDPMRIAKRAAEREKIREIRRTQAAATVPVKENRSEPDHEGFDFDPNERESAEQSVPKVENEAGENYSQEELEALYPLERIITKFKNKRDNPRRPIKASVRNRIWLRDEGMCTFQHANGERCQEKMLLEVDHIIMVCRGGSNDEENLTLKCRRHNQLEAELKLGFGFMEMKRKTKTRTQS